MDFAVLGPLEVRRDGEPVPVGGGRSRTLLIALLLRVGRVVPAEVLIEQVWADRLPANTANALQVQVSYLRRALGTSPSDTASIVRTVAGGYMLDAGPDQVDVHRFERGVSSAGARLTHPSQADAEAALGELAAALDLWRGEPLQDAAYQPFVVAEVERLLELRAVALEYDIEARLLLGLHEQAVPALRQLVADYPMRESLRAQLIVALYRSGRQADALRAFDAARELLVDELGVEPGRGLQELQRAVLAQDADLDWKPPLELIPEEPVALTIPRSGILEATLLEREHELAALGDALTDARQGKGRVVLLEAGPGLGKTTLLQAASLTAAEHDFAGFRARASELEHDFAFGCVRQLLEPALVHASEAERSVLFDGAAALALPLFAPTGALSQGPSVDSSFSMLHGLYWLLNNLTASRPVVLSIDDLQWSDTESLQFLTYLAPRLDGLAVAVLAAVRAGEQISTDVARLATSPETTVLRPRPLSVAATTTLCEHRLGAPVAPDFAGACRDATGGNPFFLEALLREAKEQNFSTDSRDAVRVERVGPAAVAQAVLLRLSVTATAAPLVRALAVLGDGASLAEIARLADIAVEDAARVVDQLVSLAILKPAERLEFAHPIVREAVYADIGRRERSRAHARAAEILAALDASPERRAAQIAEAEPAGDADRVELLRRVAADALTRGAPGAAVAWLRRALAEPPAPAYKAQVLFELGSAEYRHGSPESVDHLAAAVELTREPELLARSARWLGNALTMTGDSDRTVDALAAAIEVIETADRELALVLEAELAAHAQEASVERRAPAVRRLERFATITGATPGERLVLASLAFERARASVTEREAVQHLERALAGGRLLSEHETDVAPPFYVLLVGLLATDALELADACLEQALAQARARRSIPPQAFLIEFRGWVALRRGAVAHAEADARTALEMLNASGIQLGSAFALGLLIEALIEAGEVETADAALRDSVFCEHIPPGLANNDLLEARGLLRLAQGRTREGVDDLVEFGRRDEQWGGANPLASRWRSRAALALAMSGNTQQARGFASDDLERARRWGAATGIGVALRTAALVEGDASALDRLGEAADVLAGSPARLEYARALTEFGAALRRANRRAEARRILQDGLDLAEECCARVLAERARTELRAAGGKADDAGRPGLEQLTASEGRVAELAAQGLSNPEIAQQLFVTRKTVETHLGRVYSKLGISGRDALRGALPEPPAEGG